MGLRGVQGGLRGEIEIFPGPPAKKVIKMLICYLFVSTPQSHFVRQLPVEGSLFIANKKLSPFAGAPFGSI